MAQSIPWARLYNIFDPWSPLAPGIQIDKLFVKRHHSPLAQLRMALSPDKLPTRVLLPSQPANGKSTELVRLTRDLGEDGFLVVRLDLQQNMDAAQANPVEVLFLMGLAVYKAASDIYGDSPDRRPDQKPVQALVESLNTIIKQQSQTRTPLDWKQEIDKMVAFTATGLAGMVAGPAGAALTASALQEVGRVAQRISIFGASTEILRKNETEPSIWAMAEALNQIIRDVEAKSDKRLVILVDGLDRIEKPDRIRLMFADQRQFLGSPTCRVVYTAPSPVAYALDFEETRKRFDLIEFPNVKLFERRSKGGRQTRDEHGYVTMRAIANARFDFLGLDRAQIVSDSLLDQLVYYSGGLLRDFIVLIRKAVIKAQIAESDHITSAIAQDAINELRRERSRPLTPREWKVLDEVARTNQRVSSELCDRLLYASVILNYINEGDWYDVHTVLWDVERVTTE
jgi:hypothetical protein